MTDWNEYVEKMNMVLSGLTVRNEHGMDLDLSNSLAQWRETSLTLREEQGTVYLVGNGASASIASHVSADLAKNADLHTQVFSDLSLLTAMANDLGVEEIFAQPLARRMKKGDMLVAISSSGSSPNIIKAARVAREIGGRVVTLSAMSPQNPLRTLGWLNFHTPAETYGLAESSHATVLHYWIDLMVEATPLHNRPGFKALESVVDYHA